MVIVSVIIIVTIFTVLYTLSFQQDKIYIYTQLK